MALLVGVGLVAWVVGWVGGVAIIVFLAGWGRLGNDKPVLFLGARFAQSWGLGLHYRVFMTCLKCGCLWRSVLASCIATSLRAWISHQFFIEFGMRCSIVCNIVGTVVSLLALFTLESLVCILTFTIVVRLIAFQET